MSATDELRRMLDERGVEWRDSSDENVLHTTWNDMKCWFNEFPDGWTAWGMSTRGTPEQAIAATLGGGECEQVLTDCDDGLMPPFTAHCSKCGTEWGFTPKFCPECGAKVTGTRDERKAVKR